MHYSITTKQAAKLSEMLYPSGNLLIRLRARAVKVLEPADPLRIAIEKAQDAIQELCTIVHYLSCESGVGYPPRDDSKQ